MLSSQNPLHQPYNNPSPHNMKMIIQILKYQGFGWLIRFYFQPFLFNFIFFLFYVRDQKLKIKYKLLKKLQFKESDSYNCHHVRHPSIETSSRKLDD
jgi:hypothetical protein